MNYLFILISALIFNQNFIKEDNISTDEIYCLVNSFFVSTNGTCYIEKTPSTLYKINEIEELKSYLSEWNADTIFDDEDIDYMCEQYYQHKNFRWEESRFNSNIKVIHRTFFFQKIKSLFGGVRVEKVKKNIYYFSVPLFNKKGDRALLYYSDPIGGSNLILIKNDSGWNVDDSILLDMWIT